MTQPKIDLTLLKRLVEELESSVLIINSVQVAADKTELVVEGSKAAGLAAGVMQEAAGLMGDIHMFIGAGTMQPSGNEFLEKVLGSLKGPGTAN